MRAGWRYRCSETEYRKNKLGISALIIKPKHTRTLEPLTSPPDNPKYFFDHNDSEQLQAFGITESGDEIVLSDVSWSLSDESDTAGATTINQDGRLTTETLAANQSKEISVRISYASLAASADIVISSYPLSINGLAIKIDNIPVNDTTQNMVVCDSTSFTAEGQFEDGSTRDITNKIEWPNAITDSNAKFITDDPNIAVFSSHTNATYTIEPDYKGQGSASMNLAVAQDGFGNFTINTTSLSLLTDETFVLQVYADIDDGGDDINQNVSSRAKWTSADNNVVSVDDTGLVTAIAEGGPLDVTAQCGSATVAASLTVSIDNNIASIKIRDENSNDIDYKQLFITSGSGETVKLQLWVKMYDDTELDVTEDEKHHLGNQAPAEWG